jgi:hypothetical protein
LSCAGIHTSADAIKPFGTAFGAGERPPPATTFLPVSCSLPAAAVKLLFEIFGLLAAAFSMLTAWSCVILAGRADEKIGRFETWHFNPEQMDSDFKMSGRKQAADRNGVGTKNT